MQVQDLKLLAKAYEFASFKHRNQTRKNGNKTPYINHPIEVCRILTDCDISDVNILCGAILHDTIEDTDTSPEQLQSIFGTKVKNYVLECSDNKELGKVERKIDQITHSIHVSIQAKYIKIADKISNNYGLLKQSPQGWSKQRIFGYFVWSEAVFKNLQGYNQKLNSKMRQIFEEAGVYKHTQQQKKQILQLYYEILKDQI